MVTLTFIGVSPSLGDTFYDCKDDLVVGFEMKPGQKMRTRSWGTSKFLLRVRVDFFNNPVGELLINERHKYKCDRLPEFQVVQSKIHRCLSRNELQTFFLMKKTKDLLKS